MADKHHKKRLIGEKAMRIYIGDIIESEFGKGPVVALTDEWVVHDTGDGHEAALPKDPDGQWWIPPSGFSPNGTNSQP